MRLAALVTSKLGFAVGLNVRYSKDNQVEILGATAKKKKRSYHPSSKYCKLLKLISIAL